MMANTSTPLEQQLKTRIKANGPISVHDYITSCLYDVCHGYYKTAQPIGRDGDFITAPEISQIFGEILAIWCHLAWQDMGAPPTFNLIELGPGHATLMSDILRTLKKLNATLETQPQIDIHFIETSQTLQPIQQATLAKCDHKCFWHGDISTITPAPSVVIANEFLDCLAIDQYIYHANHWHKRCVGLDQQQMLVFVIGDQVEDLSPVSSLLITPDNTTAPEGAIFEHCPGFHSLLEPLTNWAKHHPLSSLFIDYGFWGPTIGESLQAVQKHKMVSIFTAPGESDLTAHVDFAAFAKTGQALGLNVSAMMNQGRFLSQLGIGARAEMLINNASEAQIEMITTGVLRLVAEQHMGTLFKIISMTNSDVNITLPLSRLNTC